MTISGALFVHSSVASAFGARNCFAIASTHKRSSAPGQSMRPATCFKTMLSRCIAATTPSSC